MTSEEPVTQEEPPTQYRILDEARGVKGTAEESSSSSSNLNEPSSSRLRQGDVNELEATSSSIAQMYKTWDIESNDEDCAMIAACLMKLGVAAKEIIQTYESDNPKAIAGCFGLSPGLAVDLQAVRRSG